MPITKLALYSCSSLPAENNSGNHYHISSNTSNGNLVSHKCYISKNWQNWRNKISFYCTLLHILITTKKLLDKIEKHQLTLPDSKLCKTNKALVPHRKCEHLDIIYLRASSSRSFASISLLGGYFGKLEGSQGNGFVVKNCMGTTFLIRIMVGQLYHANINEIHLEITTTLNDLDGQHVTILSEFTLEWKIPQTTRNYVTTYFKFQVYNIKAHEATPCITFCVNLFFLVCPNKI